MSAERMAGLYGSSNNSSGLFRSSSINIPSPLMISFRMDSSELFKDIDGATIMLESRVFNESPLQSKKCCYALTKLLYYLYLGGSLSESEATNIFFSMTKAFQSKDQYLRRLVYLSIKELHGLAKDVIIVTSSLIQDIGSKSDPLYRANAIRTLARITDSTLLQSIERFMKQSLMDNNSLISTTAFLSCIHLFNQGNKDAIRRWVSFDFSTPAGICKTHALSLLFLLKQSDRISILKLLQKYQYDLSSHATHSTTTILLLRQYTKLALEETPGLPDIPWKSLLSCSGPKEMIALEAAKSLSIIPLSSPSDIVHAISVLQSFLTSSKSILRFASLRILNHLSSIRPDQISCCNLDIEPLVTDSNRSIATLAITTLLKTGTDSTVDRLMSQIKNYIPDMSDELKANIIDAVGSLCLKFPSKYSGMLNFLGWRLRDEGSIAYKRSIVSNIRKIIKFIPECKELALDILCEFIEDCEYPEVACDTLSIIANECPDMLNPSRYIRHVYNRLLLETPSVKMASLGALIHFAYYVPSLRSTIHNLLQKCLLDDDDDIRDRSLTFSNLLNDQQNQLLEHCFDVNTMYSISNLEQSLIEYLNNDSFKDPFNITVQTISMEKFLESLCKHEKSLQLSPKIQVKDKENPLSIWLESNPDIASTVGQMFNSSHGIDLTEPETEYMVKCTKYFFSRHIILMYFCQNTMPHIVLENVTLQIGTFNALQIISCTPITRLGTSESEDATGYCFVLCQFDPNQELPIGTVSNSLHFITKECDSLTGEEESYGVSDEYIIQGFDINISDYILSQKPSGSFDSSWERLGLPTEAKQVFQLTNVRTLTDAVKHVHDTFGGSICDQSDNVLPNIASHTLLLSGVFLDGYLVLIRCRFAQLANGITMEITVRSDASELSAMLANAL